MRVLLLTSHAVAPPWNSGDRNLARALILGDSGVRFTFFGDRADMTPWPQEHRRILLAFRSDVPTSVEKLRLLGGLLLTRTHHHLTHIVATIRGAATQRVLIATPALQRGSVMVTCPSGDQLPWVLLRRAQAAVAISRRTARLLREGGHPNVHHIPLGIDLQRFRPGDKADARALLGIEDRPALLFAGHRDVGGGLEAAIVTAGRLRTRVPDLQLLLALRPRPGEDPVRIGAALDASCARAGIAGSIFELGPNANMRAALLASDAVLFQPRQLGAKMELPMTLVEALACGCPVVVSPLETLQELAGDCAAVHVAEPESPAVIDHLQRLVMQPRLSRELAQAARAEATARFDGRTMIAAYRELYVRTSQAARAVQSLGGTAST